MVIIFNLYLSTNFNTHIHIYSAKNICKPILYTMNAHIYFRWKQDENSWICYLSKQSKVCFRFKFIFFSLFSLIGNHNSEMLSRDVATLLIFIANWKNYAPMREFLERRHIYIYSRSLVICKNMTCNWPLIFIVISNTWNCLLKMKRREREREREKK